MTLFPEPKNTEVLTSRQETILAHTVQIVDRMIKNKDLNGPRKGDEGVGIIYTGATAAQAHVCDAINAVYATLDRVVR